MILFKDNKLYIWIQSENTPSFCILLMIMSALPAISPLNSV